jgi:hypothetical protein
MRMRLKMSEMKMSEMKMSEMKIGDEEEQRMNRLCSDYEMYPQQPLRVRTAPVV